VLRSLSPLTAVDAAPPDLVTCGADAGFDTVGIRVFPGGTDPAWPMLGGRTPMLRETLARLQDRGLRVLDVEVLRIRPDKDPSEALRILDAGAELSARYALVNCNDDDHHRLADRFAEISAAAAERGLHLGLEFMIFTTVRTLGDALALLDRAGDPADVIVLDALHLYRSGGTVTDVVAAPANRLPYLQLCDGPTVDRPMPEDDAMQEARTGRLLPGDGQLPLHPLLDALPPDTALSVEAPVAQHADRPAVERVQLAYAALDRLLSERPGHTA